MTEFKEFKLGELFEIKLSDGDNKLSELPKGSIPLISSGLENSGIVGYVNSNTELFPAKSITLDMFGNAYFQNKNFVTVSHGRVNILIWKCDYTMLNNFAALYVTSVINKATGDKYSYSSMLSSKLARELIIQLPVKDLSDEEPDWDYMEQVIKQTEAPMMNELDQWLQTKDPVLSDNEVQSILDRYQKSDFKDFRIGDLFDKLDTECLQPGKKKEYVTSNKSLEYSIPMINAKVGHNGVMYWTKPGNFHTHFNCIGVVADGAASTGLCYVYDGEVGCLYNAFLIKSKNIYYHDNLNANLYLKLCIEKVTRSKYSYTNKATWSKVHLNTIKLPVTINNEPDYQLMEDYIKVIQQKYVRNLETKLQKRIQVAKTLI